ncbi:DUF5693 family protein [Lysinibacillus antri]|uniref:Uncharacterized protein n=1 Tax=Lysinibacillus antri TaxID=2498145 RepID=A0A432LC94_9BACI|nr:DUF5693 family protein [Lysinibacillus antri]RUL53200.1 hypothetical protein EK386_09565 [Lysinibacillus antri]
MFKHQKWLWGVVILLLIISSPGLINRWNVETASNHYEIIIPYDEILITAQEMDRPIDKVLETLKDAGLTTVSLESVSVNDLKDQKIVSVYDEAEFAKLLEFVASENTIVEKGYYITIPEDLRHQQLLSDISDIEMVTFAEKPFYYLPSMSDYSINTPIGYDTVAIDTVTNHGFMLTLRYENSANEEFNEKTVEQLLTLKNDQISGLLPSGEEILGFGQGARDVWIDELTNAGYFFYTIEGSKLKGETNLARVADYDIVRLLSIDVNKEKKLTLSETVDRTTRAVKERNMKAIFYHIKMSGKSDPNFEIKKLINPSLKISGTAEEHLELATSYLKNVQERMPNQFVLGSPKLFDKVVVPSWVTGLVLLAGVLFTYLAAGIFKNNKLRLLGALGMLAIAAAYFILNRLVFLQGFALIIAVITPIYAVITSANGSTKIGKIALEYLKAVGISLIGIVIIIGLLNGNGFITGFETFRGVKLVYVIPIAGVLVYAAFVIKSMLSKDGVRITDAVKLLNKDVKYWHLLVLLVVAAIGYFYISRTGNYGAVSSVELTVRQWLEDTLYARPRTKEFLIGFPFFVLALYVMGISRKWGVGLLVLGVIGFLSMVNTFTHLHIPISVSLLRSFYSVVLGFIVGLVFIAIFKVGYRYSAKLRKE